MSWKFGLSMPVIALISSENSLDIRYSRLTPASSLCSLRKFLTVSTMCSCDIPRARSLVTLFSNVALGSAVYAASSDSRCSSASLVIGGGNWLNTLSVVEPKPLMPPSDALTMASSSVLSSPAAIALFNCLITWAFVFSMASLRSLRRWRTTQHVKTPNNTMIKLTATARANCAVMSSGALHPRPSSVTTRPSEQKWHVFVALSK
mmetsp:Transcript_65156/g.188917  ORF Transcript_65156/g.188917 Transcript_65156/m.188917 type:complete len:205 (-) Transcript_65156:1136-1750(-)